VDVDAKAPEPGHAVGEVELAQDLELLLLVGREDAVEQRARRVALQGLGAFQPEDVAVHANGRRSARHEVEIRSTGLHRACQQVVDRERRRVHEQGGYRHSKP